MYQKIAIHISLLITVLSLFSSAARAEDGSQVRGRVLVISSYGPDYQWSNSVIDSISRELTRFNPRIQINVEHLSSELIVEPQAWIDKVQMLINNHAILNPDAVILVSDEAWMAYLSCDNSAVRGVPLFLCAVKPHTIDARSYASKRDRLVMSDFTSTTSVMRELGVTGVLRSINVKDYFELIDRVLPQRPEYAVITDNRFYGIYTRLLIEEYLQGVDNNVPVKYLDARNTTTNDMIAQMPTIAEGAGVLFTSWLTGEEGFEYSRAFVYKEASATLRAPIFTTNDLGIASQNFLGGIFNNSGFWGVEVGRQVVRMFGGGSAELNQPKIFKDAECYINWQVMERFNIDESVFTPQTHFVGRPESILSRHKREIVVFCLVIFVLFGICVVVVKSNFELMSARNMASRAEKEAREVNIHLLKVQQSLQEAVAKAEAADRLKSAFISNMDRQIRVPLNTIVGFSGILSSMEEKEEIEQATRQIAESSDRLMALIKGIVKLSQIESGSSELTISAVDMNGLCADLLSLYSTKVSGDVTIKALLPDQSIMLLTDLTTLSQAIANVLDNAVKFTQTGSIELGYERADDNKSVDIFIKDSGVGIKSEDVPQLFEYFFKSDAYSTGSGLGLSITQKFVQRLGGTVTISSELGVGTDVRIKIPMNYKKI